MATGAESSASLWPTLADDELAAVTSAMTSSSTSSATTVSATATMPHSQQVLYPTQLSDLSAFLTSTHTAPVNANSEPNFLDDLLGGSGYDGETSHQHSSSTAFPHIHTHSHDQMQAETSSSMTEASLLGAAAFLELNDDSHHQGGDLNATSYASSSGASLSSPSSVGTPATPARSTSATASRLLQLETNYERKKKRAKINRKDLNSRFQELMDLLHLKEDRKLNRAKILEKAIERIEKLSSELQTLKDAQVSATQAQTQQMRPIAHVMTHTMAPHSRPHPSNTGAGAGGTLMPFDPSQAHAWHAGGASTSLPLAPMMWVPCSMMAPSRTPTLKRPAPERTSNSSNRKRGRVSAREDAAPKASTPTPAVETVVERPLVSQSAASAPMSATSACVTLRAKQDSSFVWIAQEVPALLAFCDAWTLMNVVGTCRELRKAAQREVLWDDLCRSRWWIPTAIAVPQPRICWSNWHAANRMPECAAITPGGFLFASGKAKGVSVWALLSRRSNGRTTRTVLVNKKATVMQVVELYVVVQNLRNTKLRVTGHISASSVDAGGAKVCFQPFAAGSGAHLKPHVMAFNASVCASEDVSSVVLNHGDVCVLSVFLQCAGLDLEDQFLQRVNWLDVQCEAETSSGLLEPVDVRAVCQEHVEPNSGKDDTLQVATSELPSAV